MEARLIRAQLCSAVDCGVRFPGGPRRWRGGRGSNSSKETAPATAPGLTRRFFARPKTFDFFFRNQKFKRRAREIVSAKQVPPPPLASAFVDLFSGRPKMHLGKWGGNSVGGGRVLMAAFNEGSA